MKKIIYLLIAILFVSCSSYRANKYWEKEIVNKYDKENISFKVKEYYQATNGYDSLIYYVKKTDQKYFAVDENVRYSILKEDSAKVVDLMYDELTITLKSDSIEYMLCQGMIKGRNVVNYYFLFSPENKKTFPNFKNIKAKNIDGTKYKILSFDNKRIYTKDNSTGEWIPNFSEVFLFVNNKTKLVERIETRKIKNNEFDTINEDMTYYFSDYNYNNHDSYVDSLFDFNRKEYSYFKKNYGDKRLISDERAEEKDTIMNDKILNYPILRLSGDTTTIKELDGWLLLDFWFIGCKPCMESFAHLSKEKQENGELVLEKENIKVLLINPLSSNSDMIRKTIDKFNLTEYFYHSRDINKLLPISHMPHLFLISPDKKIVYIAHGMADYTEILKIVHTY